MAITKTENRIPARMPHDVYVRIVEAAGAVGATLNQFLVQSALEKANAVIEQERIIRLTKKSAVAVFDLIDNPPKPSHRLQQAMQLRKKLLCSK